MIDNLVDAAGSAAMPQGGAATGLGGTAALPAPSPAPWAAAIAAGVLCAAAAAYWLRRGQAPGPARRGRRGWVVTGGARQAPAARGRRQAGVTSRRAGPALPAG